MRLADDDPPPEIPAWPAALFGLMVALLVFLWGPDAILAFERTVDRWAAVLS